MAVNRRTANAARKSTGVLAPVLDKSIGEFARHAMRTYGVEVNEGRSIPALQDGLKPVARRILWAAHFIAKEKVKSARLVGEVIGKYHPHGDASPSAALTTMVSQPTPTLMGIGNWGTLIDSAAAVRYTNLHLSTYGLQFLHRNYLPVTPMSPNYDDRDVEPVYLPSLLPNILINDNMGIGVGVATSLPAFTPTSLLKLLLRLLDKEQMEPIDYAKALEFFEPWGGIVVKSKLNRSAVLDFMSNTSGSIEFESPLEEQREAKRILLNKFAPHLNLDKFVTACRLIPGVDSVYSGKGLSFVVQVKRTVNFNDYDAIVAKVRRLTTTKQKFSLYVSDRKPYLDEKTGKTAYTVDFHSLTVPQLLLKWLKFRIQLEADSLDWQIVQQEKELAYLTLLIHACDHLDVIFAALRKADPATHIAKGLSISLDDAKQILELKVRQLSKLDQDALKLKLSEVKAKLKVLQTKRKRPAQSVRAYFEHCLERFSMNDDRTEGCQQWWLKANAKA